MAKIERVIPMPGAEGRFLAMIEPGTFLPFDRDVPRLVEGRPMEAALTEPDWTPKKGGAVQLAVQRLPQDLERIEATRYDPHPAELSEGAEPFERPVLERLARRPYREVAFRRKVREAYGYRGAKSGLMLRNGGGRPEVQAAHVRPVESQRSDSVRNGLALSGTLHWMFDRGLISVAEDCVTILVSHNKVPGEVVGRLLAPDGRLVRPEDPRERTAPGEPALAPGERLRPQPGRGATPWASRG
ncbi:HNH endonuclease [Tranquillimonas rosea]|uniref:HNH endonuclease n=1 Tax=Tranquillimonas rosea TaxID=641238 RepID=UPI003BAC6D36